MVVNNFPLNVLSEGKVKVELVIETSFTKELSITMKTGMEMKEHKTSFPIIIHILDGEIEFSYEGNILILCKGEIVTLAQDIPHSLKALEDSIIRLSLMKGDEVKRVEGVVAK